MKVLGIDPGQSGALAILDGNSVVFVGDLPVHLIAAGKKAPRPELDLHGLHQVISQHTPIDHAYVEKVAARPGNGSVSMFRFGMSFGAVLGVISAMAVPLTLVQPKDWQKWAGCGPAPDAARQRAVQLYPDMAERLARKRDCHRADALLLAGYGAQINGRDTA